MIILDCTGPKGPQLQPTLAHVVQTVEGHPAQFIFVMYVLCFLLNPRSPVCLRANVGLACSFNFNASFTVFSGLQGCKVAQSIFYTRKMSQVHEETLNSRILHKLVYSGQLRYPSNRTVGGYDAQQALLLPIYAAARMICSSQQPLCFLTNQP